MASRLRAKRTQPRVGADSDRSRNPAFMESIRAALEGYLKGRRLLDVKTRQAEGRSVAGFLKIQGDRGERLLVDFKAVTTRDGTLSSLEVAGRTVSFAVSTTARRSQ